MNDPLSDNKQTLPPKKTNLWRLLPLGIFMILAGVFLVRLYSGDASIVPSALINKNMPMINLPALADLEKDGKAVPGFKTDDFKDGKVTVLNVWASWCGPCREEHPLLSELEKDKRLRLVGLNYKDSAENARRFLDNLGNPFTWVGVDRTGRAGIELGVYGVPETFIINGKGKIVYKHVGPINLMIMETILKPQIEKALMQ